MKKIYQEPEIEVAKMSHNQMLCSSHWEDPDVEPIYITDDEEDILPPI